MEYDDIPVLSGSAAAALEEFYAERSAQEKQYEALKTAIDTNGSLSMEMFSEDWNASQFWYSDETALDLAKELLDNVTNDTSIAVISAPSVFVQLKNLISSGWCKDSPRISLLEYDRRFNVLEEFTPYDYNAPLDLPMAMKGQFDRMISDPPFLSEDCQTKAAMTARFLLRKSDQQKIIVCTGERMEQLIPKLYAGTKTTTFEVKHTKGLSNEFRCYANYEGPRWKWQQQHDAY